MKCKVISCNDTRGFEEMITKFLEGKQLVHVSSTLFVHGNFITTIIYYDKQLDLDI